MDIDTMLFRGGGRNKWNFLPLQISVSGQAFVQWVLTPQYLKAQN
jgi:hypothetical protein